MDEPAKYLDFPVPPGEADELTRGSHPVIWNNKTKRALIGPRNAFHYQLRDAAERLGEGFGYDTDGRIAPASPGEDRSYVYEHYDPYTDEREVYSHIQPFVNKRFPHYDFRPPGALNHQGFEDDLWNFNGDSHFGSVRLLDAPVSPAMNVQDVHGDSRPVVFIPESRIAILGGQNVTHDQITPRKLVQGKTPINGRIYQNTLEFFAPHPGQIEPHHQELLEAFAPHGVTRIVNGQWHAGDGPSEEDQLWNFSKAAYDNPNWSIMPEGESIQGSPNIQVMTPMPREEGRRVPFLTTVNQSYDKSRLYFGRPGDSHHDIAMRHKLGEDEEWDEDAYGGVEDGRYHELYADGVHGPELAEIMERNGFPEKPDDDDWTFSRTKSSSLREQSLTDLINGRVPRALSNNKPMWNLSSVKVSEYPEYFDDIEDQIAKGLPGTADPTKAQPWRKGQPGKGYLDAEGNIHTWAVNQDMGAPHHQEISRLRGHEVAAPFYIEPYGGVTADPWIEPHHLQVLETQLPHHKLFLDKDKSEDDLWSFAKTATLEKTADKLNDFLMNPKSRPDLQTPDAQQFLGVLNQHYHNGRTDEMMPWLTREWKKNRISYAPDGLLQYNVPGQPSPQRLAPVQLNNWSNWYYSNHPNRVGVDLMQKKIHDVHDLVAQHDADVAASKAEAEPDGVVHHQWPNGWTIQQLHTPEALTREGKLMGHCVGDYHRQVADGDTKIYSLRDSKNTPHLTMEIMRDPEAVDDPSSWDREKLDRELATPKMQGYLHDWYMDEVDRLRDHYDSIGAEPDLAERFPRPTDEQMYQKAKDEVHRQIDHYHQTGWSLDPKTRAFFSDLLQGTEYPHGGRIKQIQGKGNTIPKKSYQSAIKQWMSTIPENERPIWRPETGDESIEDFDQIAIPIDNPDGPTKIQYAGGYIPHGDYGVRASRVPTLWDDLVNSYDPKMLDPEDAARVLYEHWKHQGDTSGYDPTVVARKIHKALARNHMEADQEHEDEFNRAYFENGEYGHPMDDVNRYDLEDSEGNYDHLAEEHLRNEHLENAREHWNQSGRSEHSERADAIAKIRSLLEKKHRLPNEPMLSQDQERMGSWSFTPAPEPKSLEWTFPGTSRVVAASGSEALWSLTPA